MPLLELEPNPWLVSYGIFLGLPPKITTARPPRVRAHTRLTLFRLALTTALYTHLTAARPREASERLFWRVRRGAWPQAQRAGARQSAGVVASCAGSVGKILVQQAFTTTKLCQRTRGTRGGRPVSGARRAGGPPASASRPHRKLLAGSCTSWYHCSVAWRSSKRQPYHRRRRRLHRRRSPLRAACRPCSIGSEATLLGSLRRTW